MVRILIAAVLGAIVVFVWNWAAWMFLPIHEGTLNKLPNEEEVKSALKAAKLKPGYYIIPGMPEEDESASAEEKKKIMDDWMDEHRKGPVVSIIYSEGSEPMPPLMMVQGFGINLVSALIAALLLSAATCCRLYPMRVGFVLGLGLFTSIYAYGGYWNWMGFPLDFTLAMIADVVIGWTLAGILMGIVIRPKPTE